MLPIPLIKDLTPKVFHMVVIIKDVLDKWSLFCFMFYTFVLVSIQTLCYDFLHK